MKLNKKNAKCHISANIVIRYFAVQSILRILINYIYIAIFCHGTSQNIARHIISHDVRINIGRMGKDSVA